MIKLTNKVVWITGASSGIGEALVYELAKKRARLILSARRKEELERVKGNCPRDAQANVRILPLDLSQSATLQLSTEAALQIFGTVDIVIHNGGSRQKGLVKDTPLDADKRIMDVNFFGAVAITKFILPHFLKKRAGHLVVVSSITGKFATPYRSGYAASKHALHGFFDAVRAEHFKDNIKVSMICPGFVQTPSSNAPSSGDGSVANKVEENRYKGMPPSEFAKKMVSAIERQKQEVYIGGREVFGVYLKRWFPGIFSNLIRKVAVR